MKRISTLLVVCLICCLCVRATEVRMMVVSDMHVMDVLLFDNGTAFRNYSEGEPKIVEHSAELMDSALARVIAAHPDILLIPGDLTKDGEWQSHMTVSDRLNSLVDAGIRVLVVPGNHDIANPSAYSYIGEQKAAVPSVTMSQFDSIYSRCGYADAVLRQPSDLSYLAYPADGLAVICLNSTQVNDGYRHSAGGLTEETLAWAEEAAAQARQDGRYVIAMMHHQVTEHFDKEAQLASTYVANQEDGYPALDSLQARFIRAGIEVVLTGHFHIHSIQRAKTDEGVLYDVSTGALCSYASPLRYMTLDEGLLTISSDTIGLYHELEMQRNGNTVSGAARTMSTKYYDQYIGQVYSLFPDTALTNQMNIPSSASELEGDIITFMYEPMLELLNVLALGDEPDNDGFMVYVDCKAAFDDYYNYILNGVSLEVKDIIKMAAIKGTAESMIENELSSILENYVSHSVVVNYIPQTEKDTVADWELSLQMKTPPAVTALPAVLTEVPSNRSGVYTLDGKMVSGTEHPKGWYIVNGEVKYLK